MTSHDNIIWYHIISHPMIQDSNTSHNMTYYHIVWSPHAVQGGPLHHTSKQIETKQPPSTAQPVLRSPNKTSNTTSYNTKSNHTTSSADSNSNGGSNSGDSGNQMVSSDQGSDFLHLLHPSSVIPSSILPTSTSSVSSSSASSLQQTQLMHRIRVLEAQSSVGQ
jgi:hypothetical protein